MRLAAAALLLAFAGASAWAADPCDPSGPQYNPLGCQPLRLAGFVVEDDGDGDGFADSRETATLRIRVFNAGDAELTAVTARLVEQGGGGDVCVTGPLLNVGDVAAGETVTSTAGFTLRVVEAPGPEAILDVWFSADGIGELPRPQRLSLDLDLDVAGGSGPTTFFEGFESGLGRFTSMQIDESLNPPDGDLGNYAAGRINADGYRCQYVDPDWEQSVTYPPTSPAASDCFPNPNFAPDRFWWQATSERAFSGTQSLYFGLELDPALGLTTPLAQLEAVRTQDPINLAWERRCSVAATACAVDADCPDGESCDLPWPVLSFKQQVSLMDHRTINAAAFRAADRGVVQLQRADATGAAVGDWIKLVPYVNVYDSQANSNFFNCSFDPIDDGNDEGDFFQPADPQRFKGPSSTCAPEFNFTHQGSTAGPFDPEAVGDAEGPGLEGTSPDQGTWVEPRIDLGRYRGARARLRFLTTGLELGSVHHWESIFVINPDPGDDGWFIDDVTVTETLDSPAVRSVDTKPNDHLPPTDPDGDGIECDTCPLDPNPDQADPDGDGLGDACDDCPGEAANDPDEDGLCCPEDNCCATFNPGQLDADGDGVGDACDNCLADPNPDQADAVHPGGAGDACEDLDGDALTDAQDNCPGVANAGQADLELDGHGDACDLCPTKVDVSQGDADDDGVGDLCDPCPFAPAGDADGDGVDEACDNCPGVANPAQFDPERDGLGAECDNCPLVANPDQADLDLDSLGDACDACPVSDPAALVRVAGPGYGQWTLAPDDRTVTLLRGGRFEVLSLAPTAVTMSGPKLGPGGSVSASAWSADGSRLVFRASLAAGLAPRIYALHPSDGTVDELATLREAPAGIVTVPGYAIVFDDRDLVAVPLHGAPPIELDAALGPNAGIVGRPVSSPDGNTVVFTADADLADGVATVDLFAVPVTGGVAVNLSGVPDWCKASDGVVAPDGRAVLYMATCALHDAQIYRVAIGGGIPARLSAPEDLAVASFRLSPDGLLVVYTARRQVGGLPALFVVATDGGVPQPLRPLPKDRQVRSFEIDPTGARVVYFADQVTLREYELFSIPIGGGPSTQISAPLLDANIGQWLIGPDGTDVFYRLVGGPLYRVAIAFGGVGELLPTPVVYSSFALADGGDRVIYCTPQRELYLLSRFDDPDGDGVPDACDNCTNAANADQTDWDADAWGNVCDCDVTDPAVYPGAPEAIDGRDNQCPGDTGHGETDEITGPIGFFTPGDRDRLSWPGQAGAVQYDVRRSTSPTFPAYNSTFVMVPQWLVTGDPAPDEVWYLIVR